MPECYYYMIPKPRKYWNSGFNGAHLITAPFIGQSRVGPSRHCRVLHQQNVVLCLRPRDADWHGRSPITEWLVSIVARPSSRSKALHRLLPASLGSGPAPPATLANAAALLTPSAPLAN